MALARFEVNAKLMEGLPVGLGGFWVMIGAGGPAGVTLLDASEGELEPAALTAVTVKV